RQNRSRHRGRPPGQRQDTPGRLGASIFLPSAAWAAVALAAELDPTDSDDRISCCQAPCRLGHQSSADPEHNSFAINLNPNKPVHPVVSRNSFEKPWRWSELEV